MTDDMDTEESRMATLDERRYTVLRDEVREALISIEAQTSIFPEDTPARRFGELASEKIQDALDEAKEVEP